MIDNPVVLHNVIQLLPVKDILILEIALNKMLDDTFWRCKCISMFGKEFWDKACARPKESSFPLSSWKDELLRIEKFQYLSEKTLQYRWSINDFYTYWDKYDTLKNIF